MSISQIALLLTLYQLYYCIVNAQCPYGGHWVAHGCNTSSQCISYSHVAVSCVDGECCTLASATKCSNGGLAVAHFCKSSEECIPYTSEPVACLSRTCCTIPQKCPNGGKVIGIGCLSTPDCANVANGVSALSSLMKSLFLLYTLLYGIPYVQAWLGRTQSAAVKGVLLCNGNPLPRTLVKLYDDDRGIDSDDLLAEGHSDQEGRFELSGHTDETTPIDPKLNIYHDC
uniref:CC domain-containing protein n=1 Tax=Ascaris lumbricoides TaxID=6252 RepID=A0A0M3IGH8_ASCLU